MRTLSSLWQSRIPRRAHAPGSSAAPPRLAIELNSSERSAIASWFPPRSSSGSCGFPRPASVGSSFCGGVTVTVSRQRGHLIENGDDGTFESSIPIFI